MPEDAKVHVGNLSFDTREDDLMYEFERYGRVEQVQIIKDRDTGRPKGYGFVMFENSEDARDAIYGLDQKKFLGRVIKCEKARPRRSEGETEIFAVTTSVAVVVVAESGDIRIRSSAKMQTDLSSMKYSSTDNCSWTFRYDKSFKYVRY
ncbi:RNA-binding [Paramuricea clavata]|uniref:RNA-binding n=1 Tax=Paramuricea clavata TaxID=317549 RepID=A0A7D9HRY7_PARCT|nr:RNA-binding [Paramuricea clavata]